MAGIPRSQALIQLVSSSSAAVQQYWGSPLGFITLVKSLYIRNEAGSALNCAMYWNPVWLGTWEQLFTWTVENNATLEQDLWLVLNEQDAVLLLLTAGPSRAVLSGAVLAGREQFPANHSNAVAALPAALPARPLDSSGGA